MPSLLPDSFLLTIHDHSIFPFSLTFWVAGHVMSLLLYFNFSSLTIL